MTELLQKFKYNGRYKRLFLFSAFSTLLVLLGIQVDDDKDGSTEQMTKSNSLIPKAHADAPYSQNSYQSNYTGDSGDGDCNSGSNCGNSSCGSCGSASGCDSCCFPASALIETPAGPKAISELSEGDNVVSYDEVKGEFTTSVIEKVLRHSNATGDAHDFVTHPLLTLTFQDNEGSDQKLTITANHPVLDVSTNTYRPAGEIKVGDAVKTQTTEVTISEIVTEDVSVYFNTDSDPVLYNLTVKDGPATYVAGNIVVHNKTTGGDCCLPGNAQISIPNGGQIAISEVKVDSEVTSYDENSQTWATSIVGEKIVHDGELHVKHDFSSKPLLKILFADDSSRQLIITANHPIFVTDTNSYKPAGELSVGESLLTETGIVKVGEILPVEPAEVFQSDEPIVYDLHMKSGPQNFLADGILVHNKPNP